LNDGYLYAGSTTGTLRAIEIETGTVTTIATSWCSGLGSGWMDDFAFDFDSMIAYTSYACQGIPTLYTIDLFNGDVTTQTGNETLRNIVGMHYYGN